MPTYVMLANWTAQGVRTIEEGPKRVDVARKSLEDMGGLLDLRVVAAAEEVVVQVADAQVAVLHALDREYLRFVLLIVARLDHQPRNATQQHQALGRLFGCASVCEADDFRIPQQGS